MNPKYFSPRIPPYVISGDLNQAIPVATGPFRLAGPSDGTLDSDLVFRWMPSTVIEFEGPYDAPLVDLGASGWTLSSEGERGVAVPVYVTNTTIGGETSVVRGVTQDSFAIGNGPFEQLRFSLANFPDYLGAFVSDEPNGWEGCMAARLEVAGNGGVCRIDKIPEVDELVKRAQRESGFVISHVGTWTPDSGIITVHQADSVIRMLHFWCGLLRGAWAGPVFPQGLQAGEVVWQQFARWKVPEARGALPCSIRRRL
jgi:hypothetical protein